LPHLTRSALRRCLERHGIARLPGTEGIEAKRSRSKPHPIGFFHVDTAEVHAEEGRPCLVPAVDHTSKCAVAHRHGRATRRGAADLLPAAVATVPCRIGAVPTDNGTRSVDRSPASGGGRARREHRLTKIR
jgi:hypothetical protein